MQVNIVCCLFILNSEKNENIRKNDIKKIKVLTNHLGMLPNLSFQNGDMKQTLRKHLENIIGSNKFHLEQVYTMDYDNSIDIIYLAITNIENISKLDAEYELRDFKIENNEWITFGENNYKYKTKEIEESNNIEYVHEINIKDSKLKRILLSLLISYKKIRSNIDNTDILFKFLGSSFTLEDVRIVYELIKDKSVDKSNFRKKITKYCEKIDTKDLSKKGYRQPQKYKFKPFKGDAWL